MDTTIILGEILAFNDDSVEVTCLLNESPQVLSVRRFSILPFKKTDMLGVGVIIEIKTIIMAGKMEINFSKADQTLSEKFNPVDLFSSFEGTPFSK